MLLLFVLGYWNIKVLSNHIYTYGGLVSIATMITFNYCVMREKQCFSEHNHRTTSIKGKDTTKQLYTVFGTYNSLFLAHQKEKPEADYVVPTDLGKLCTLVKEGQSLISVCYHFTMLVLTAVCNIELNLPERKQ